MRALHLEYLSEGARSRFIVIALALFAAAFASDSVLRYRSLMEELQEMRTAAARSPVERRKHVPAPAFSPDELAMARDTARRLSVPWNSLFQGLEAARTDRVTLLSIEPDAESRTLVLSAEAKDYAAALAYVGNLAEQPGFARVHLSRHEARPGSERPIAFSVSASWKGTR